MTRGRPGPSGLMAPAHGQRHGLFTWVDTDGSCSHCETASPCQLHQELCFKSCPASVFPKEPCLVMT